MRRKISFWTTAMEKIQLLAEHRSSSFHDIGSTPFRIVVKLLWVSQCLQYCANCNVMHFSSTVPVDVLFCQEIEPFLVCLTGILQSASAMPWFARIVPII